MLNDIVKPLTEWYRQNKRSLPWRDRHNAYYTWVSEIMLQQTRVEAVKPYFRRFTEELPDPAALAECPEEKLLKLWEGLGYYNRVRNMQIAAQTVVEEYDGVLPASYEKLLSLKGIGSYTAGAIASIAYDIPVPAVDGNVLRVITRIIEDDGDIMKQSVKKRIENKLQEIMPGEYPGDFNQALMELGAVVCVPNGEPKCDVCPVAFCCGARAHGTIDRFPVKAQKKDRKLEDRTVLVIQDGEKQQSAGVHREDFLRIYELPNLKGHLSEEEVLESVKAMDLEPLRIEALPEAKHIFSHIEWHMTGYEVIVDELEKTNEKGFLFIHPEEIRKEYSIPSAFEKYTGYAGIER